MMPAVRLWVIAALLLSAFRYDNDLITEKSYDFSLLNVDGKMVSLADYPDAKGFIIVFTCNHCPFARLYSERLNKLSEKYKSQGVPLLAISSTDTLMYAEDGFEEMKKKANEEHFNFPYLYDGKQEVARNYKADRTPQAFILWKIAGNWTVSYKGAIDDNGAEPELVQKEFVSLALDELLSGKPVSIATTSSVGCKLNYRRIKD